MHRVAVILGTAVPDHLAALPGMTPVHRLRGESVLSTPVIQSGALTDHVNVQEAGKTAAHRAMDGNVHHVPIHQTVIPVQDAIRVMELPGLSTALPVVEMKADQYAGSLQRIPVPLSVVLIPCPAPITRIMPADVRRALNRPARSRWLSPKLSSRKSVLLP